MTKEGGHENFFWQNQTWVLSNSEKSGGSEENSGQKLPGSNSSSQTGIGKEAAKINKKRDQGEMNKNDKESNGEVKEGKSGGGESDHEIHIWTERERRKKMRNMFSNLHALLPQLPPKADKSTIVDEAVNYIKTLQSTLQKLQKQKLERLQCVTNFGFEPSSIAPHKLVDSREAFLADQGCSSNLAIAAKSSNVTGVPRYPILFQTWTSSNVVLNVCGDEAQISICSSKKPGLFTTICYLLEKYNIEVLSAHVSSDCNRIMYMIQAQASGAFGQFAEPFSVEEIYKQAASEIMCWVSS